MESKEYSAYIKGLIEGAGIDTATPEGKVIAALSALASQMADELDELTTKLETCNAYIEEIDEDLGAVEELIYSDDDCELDDDDLDDECDGDCSCCCGCDDEDDEDDEDEYEDDEEFYCAMCPHCGGKIYFSESVNPEDVICPSCQKPLVDDSDDLSELDGKE